MLVMKKAMEYWRMIFYGIFDFVRPRVPYYLTSRRRRNSLSCTDTTLLKNELFRGSRSFADAASPIFVLEPLI
jgi:hypothetical protein